MTVDPSDDAGMDGPSLRSLAPVLGCVFITMIGYGIALTVLPLYTQRIHELVGASNGLVAFHLGVLISIFALVQLVAGPTVGKLSDRFGRRPLILLGLAGASASQIAFAFTSSLWWLYALRLVGGLATSLLTVGATAAIADQTNEANRARGMAWYGTAASLGVVAGPILGGVLGRVGVIPSRGIRLDGFTLPFVAAGALALIGLVAAFMLVPESRDVTTIESVPSRRLWRSLMTTPLFGLVASAQFGLAVFEGTFVLYARARYGFDAGQTTAAYVVCGAVMGVLQAAVVGPLSRFINERHLAAAGFVFMGVGIGALIIVGSFALVLSAVGILAIGTALVIPNLSSLIATESGRSFGAALGLQSSATSLGQFAGPLIGGALLAWQQTLPYTVAAILLLAVAAVMTNANRMITPRGNCELKQDLRPARNGD
jgi:DHA1 family multidrug resistance protein-like MFS transporter